MNVLRSRKVADLALFWKLFVPFFVLLLVMGLAGAFLIPRNLTQRAEAAMNEDLLSRSVAIGADANRIAVSLLSSVRIGANIEGVPESVARRDGPTATRLLASALVYRDEPPDLLAAVDDEGVGLVEFKSDADAIAASAGAASWRQPQITRVLEGAATAVWFDERQGRRLLLVAGPVETAASERVGVMIAGIETPALIDLERLADVAGVTDLAGIALYASDGALVAESGSETPLRSAPKRLGVRRSERRGAASVATLYTPLDVLGSRLGSIGISVPAEPYLSSARTAGLRLGALLLLGMAAVVAIGAVLSRVVLSRVTPLVATTRAIGRGELGARAPVLGADELGELARGLNSMAEELAAAQTEQESRVQQATEELRRLYDDVVELGDRRRAAFTAVSHDFRTPLFAIIANADMLLDARLRPKTKGWSIEAARRIKESGQHLLALVDQIVELAQVESGRTVIDAKSVSVGAVVDELRATIVPLARRGDLDVEIVVAADVPRVRADPVRLKQIVLNLVSNAIKYTSAGGRVSISVRKRNRSVEIIVSDTGSGISSDDVDHVFEPFFRAQDVEAAAGYSSSGLGLAITKRLVEAHDGSIEIESAPGQGTTFTVRLPAATRRR